MVIEFSAPTARGLTTQRVSDYKLHFAASDDYLTKALPLTQTSEHQTSPDFRLHPGYDI